MKSNLSNVTHKWVDLLRPFSAGYSFKMSASELAKKTKIPQQTASRYLNDLAKVNLIDYISVGKNKLFYFDLEKQTTKIILNLIENQKALQFQLSLGKIAVIIEQVLKNCESLIVFGSYASGRFDEESDLDMVILGKSNKEEIKKIKQRQIMEINEHYVSYKEFEKILNLKNALALEIMKNHVLFGDISKIVDIFWRKEHE